MADSISIAKNELIKKYFKDDMQMQDIVERAFNGEGCCQEILADWFEKNGYIDQAKLWGDMAKTSYQEKSK